MTSDDQGEGKQSRAAAAGGWSEARDAHTGTRTHILGGVVVGGCLRHLRRDDVGRGVAGETFECVSFLLYIREEYGKLRYGMRRDDDDDA